MTDSACLTCETATFNSNFYIVFVSSVCSFQRLTSDDFQSLKTKIIVNIFFINCHFTGTWCKVYTSDTGFSSSCSVKC
nr:MAG TPA: hypothetical protein [Caudoviricetes sp.]